MKKNLIVLPLILLSMGITKSADTPKPMLLTSAEREFAIQYLKKTALQVDSSLLNLTPEQMAFKPGTDKWSIAECVLHIAAAEATLWDMLETSLKEPANAEKREKIKFTDQELIKAVEDRSHKSKTFAALEPANSPYKSVKEALKSFKENRRRLIAFVQSTQKDLRSQVLELPLGTYDAYQFILLISAHSNRHVQQIKEIKAEINFP
jgi:hypothetical protein